MIIASRKIRILLAAISFAFVLGLRAADPPPDLSGVGDPPHFKRYEGSRLFRFSEKKFDALIIPLGRAQEKDTFEKSVELEGEVQKSRIGEM